MTEYIEPEDVDALIARWGFHYRDRGLMLSVLGRPYPVFGEEMFPSLDEKAAAYLTGWNADHPLHDGNKRTSWAITAAFYEINGYDLIADVDDGYAFVKRVADGHPEFAEVVAWLAEHARELNA